jgi:hypothetical protein
MRECGSPFRSTVEAAAGPRLFLRLRRLESAIMERFRSERRLPDPFPAGLLSFGSPGRWSPEGNRTDGCQFAPKGVPPEGSPSASGSCGPGGNPESGIRIVDTVRGIARPHVATSFRPEEIDGRTH